MINNPPQRRKVRKVIITKEGTCLLHTPYPSQEGNYENPLSGGDKGWVWEVANSKLMPGFSSKN